VFGDFFANVNDFKAVKSSFRMLLDYETIIKSAYGATGLYFKAYDNKEEYLCEDTSSNDEAFDFLTW
jgi:hypothetical protein